MTGSMLAIAPLWLMLAAANTSAYAQTPDNVSNASATTTPAPSPAEWTQFHRDNMQRWNPYETVLNVNNVGDLQLKWQAGIGNYAFGGSSPPW
jgi:glucose dehydrogenase